jgi:hypothetical protein
MASGQNKNADLAPPKKNAKKIHQNKNHKPTSSKKAEEQPKSSPKDHQNPNFGSQSQQEAQKQQRQPPQQSERPPQSKPVLAPVSAPGSILTAAPRFDLAATLASLPSSAKRTPFVTHSGGGPAPKKAKTQHGESSVNSAADQGAIHRHSSPPKQAPAREVSFVISCYVFSIPLAELFFFIGLCLFEHTTGHPGLPKLRCLGFRTS